MRWQGRALRWLRFERWLRVEAMRIYDFLQLPWHH